MSLNLSRPPAGYDPADETQMRHALERADRQNLKAGVVFDKLLLRDATDGTVKTLTVAAGVVVIA